MTRQIISTMLLACTILAPVHAASSEAIAKTIRQNEDAWNKDFEAKDTAKLIAHYAEDATLMAPGMPPTHGKEAIAKVLAGMVNDAALSLKFQATRVEVAKSGDMAFAEGTYTMTMTNPANKKPMSDKGTYVTVYKKQADGSWKAVSDIASSSAMPGN